jgi:eukaryotic-like serine/threonine-protein kinase
MASGDGTGVRWSCVPQSKDWTEPALGQKTVVMPVGKSAHTVVRGADKTEVLANQSEKKDARGSAVRPSLDFSRNRVVGRFEMIREIARGGQGQVFLARDVKLGRKIAIKFLVRDDPDFVQRFVIEARATARCTHENIITIYEVGEHEGLPYMVLEYLEGKTLSEVISGNPTVGQFTEIMVATVRALERAHEHGIVHRDLKPSNIFVTDRGQVKVLDFGVARLIDRAQAATELGDRPSPAVAVEPGADAEIGASSVTRTGSNSLVGTLPYMAPEQWGADVVDHQSDLWAVGIMFWHALTGVHPVGSTAPAKLRANLMNLDLPLPSIGAQDATLPPELVALVDRCLAKHKRDRFQNATELLAALQAFVTPTVRAAEDVCPYRGLAAFGEEDAKYFFGRSNEIRTALAQLDSWPLLAVIGPSGVGKSSFVHAGLVPAVRATGGNWQIRVMRPGRVPLQRLANVLEEAQATGDHGDVMEQLRDAPGLFGSLLRTAAERRSQRVLVVVDQLEELFTLCDSDEVRKVFLAALLAAADDPSSPVRVVLSMRADFLDRLAGHRDFLTELSRGLFFLTAPDQENLRETIVRPAELAGYAFEDASIVADMMQAATSRGALPLVSFAATRMWDARDRERKLLTRSAYQHMGGVGGAFARHADQVAAAIPPSSQILLRGIMTRLVTPEGTRAVVDHAELLSLGEAREVEQVLDQLVRGRLIQLHVDDDQVATVEIVHEMLISEWPTLARWLEDSHALRGFMHELRQAARQWDAHGRSRDLVWRGAPAQEAIVTAKRHVLDLSAVEAAFLDAIRVYAARSRRRKVAVVSSVFVVLCLVLAGGAYFTIQLARANQLAMDREAAATRAAQEAEAARNNLQHKLDIIEEKEKARLAAEAAARAAQDKAMRADEDVKLSREELQKANLELRRALDDARAEKQRAQVSAELARKASADAKAAHTSAEAAAAREKARADKLEQESKSIYNKDLRTRRSGDPESPGGLK